jgi:flagellar hook-basal body complex protein FliE
MTMDVSKIDRMVAMLQAHADMAAGRVRPAAPGMAAETQGFGNVLKTSLNQVNQTQVTAEKTARDFEMGAPNVNLGDVMVSIQKANIGFQGAVQVRNRLVAAYHDIMNMQI